MHILEITVSQNLFGYIILSNVGLWLLINNSK